MQRLESFDNLDKNSPNVILFEIGLLFLVLANFLKEIAIIGVLHYNTVSKKGHPKEVSNFDFKMNKIKGKGYK